MARKLENIQKKKKTVIIHICNHTETCVGGYSSYYTSIGIGVAKNFDASTFFYSLLTTRLINNFIIHII